jgi:uncharacterized membrane protein
MAQSATKKRPAAKAGSRKQTPRRASPNGRSAATRKPKAAARGGGAARHPVATARKKVLSGLAKRVAKPAAGKLVRAAARAGGETVRRAAKASGLALKAAGRGAAELAQSNAKETGPGSPRRLPIQRSVDVAVPVAVAWEEWLRLDFLPEGIHRVEEIERDGSELVGRIAGPRGRDWAAEIRDERADESFAWRSVEGSDCAGLLTFHQLSERLTRLELNLDLRPSGPAEAVALTLHLADSRAEADLRRFKARVELIDPDEYADLQEEEPEAESANGDSGRKDEQELDEETRERS